MSFCKEYQLEMPVIFPGKELTDFRAAARAVLLKPTKSKEWSEFAGASNLIGWRFRAANEYWQAYRSSWERCGANVGLKKCTSGNVTSMECFQQACPASNAWFILLRLC